METKHTPGPYEFSDGSIWAKSPFNARVRIADIRKHSPMNGINSDANAKLFTAAPDLFEACKAMLLCRPEGWVHESEPDSYETAIRLLKTAITKAEGDPLP